MTIKDRLSALWASISGFIARYYHQIIHYYQTHPVARKRSIIGSIILGPPFLLLLVILIETPSKRSLRYIRNQVGSEVYSADSVLLGKYYIQDRTEIRFEEIGRPVIQALIATEDERFYQHQGVDFESLGRVLVKSILMQDESAGGGSTLSQQLAKNLFPRKRYWVLTMVINKSKEFLIASRLEDILNKDEILTLYLNTVPFGDQTFGIEAASKKFFNKRALHLSTEQAAVLIGMLKATTSYNPRLYPKRALTRRNVVLSQMVKLNYLEKSLADSLKAIPITLNYNRFANVGIAPYFREFIKTELNQWCLANTKGDGTPYNIYTDGLKIYTTIDSRMQIHAEAAVAEQMSQLQKQFYSHWGKVNPWQDNERVVQDALRRTNAYKRLKEAEWSDDEIIAELSKPYDMRYFTWDGESTIKSSPLDSIKHHLKFLNAGFMVMSPADGNIKAYVGGIDYDFFQYDHVKPSTKRQIGSIFKPFVYGVAIDRGADPCTLVSATRQTYIDREGKPWTPRNSQVDYEVEYTMRGALAYSVNTVAVKAIQEAGINETIEVARKTGIESPFEDVPSIALGSTDVSLYEMTGAYTSFINGTAVKPRAIVAIEDREGKRYELDKPEKLPQAFTPETATLVRRMLQTVTTEGTASRIRWRYGVYSDIAGKTGTTQSNADGWFMGITPDLVAGAWVGAEDRRIRFRSTELGQGSNTALPIVGYFFNNLYKDTVFQTLKDHRFKDLSSELSQRLDCDLYKLSDTLQYKIAQEMFRNDSISRADTSKVIKDTYLMQLYKRRQKIMRSQSSDSTDTEKIVNVGG